MPNCAYVSRMCIVQTATSGYAHKSSPRRPDHVQNRASKECTQRVERTENSICSVDCRRRVWFPASGPEHVQGNIKSASETDLDADDEVLPVFKPFALVSCLRPQDRP